MDSNSLKNINLLTFSAPKIQGIKKDIAMMERALVYLKNGERLSSCYAYEVFHLIFTDLEVLQEALKKAVLIETDPNILCTLQEYLSELDAYLTKAITMQNLFQPYLYCPALEGSNGS